MSSLKVNVSIYFAANTTVALIPFLLMPILTRYLGPEGYGVVAMFITFTTLLAAVIGLNAHNGIATRWFDKDEINFPQYVTACLFILIVSSLFLSLLFFVVRNWLSAELSVPVFWLYAAIVLSTATFITQVRLVLWQVDEKPIKYGVVQFGQALINGVLSYIAVAILLDDYAGRLWGQVLSGVFCGALCLFLLYKEGYLKWSTRWEYIKDALAFGVPLVPHVLGSFFLLMADRMIVNFKLGTASAGIYMLAVQIALGFNLINEAFNKAFVPWLFARLKKDELNEKIRIVRLSYMYFLALLIAPLFSVLLGKHFITILAGPKFLPAATVLNWLILMQSFHGMYYLVTNYLFYERKTHVTAVITIICGGINLALTVFLVDAFGLVGAGISSAVGMFLHFLLTWIMAARVHPMPWFSSLIFQKNSRFVSMHPERSEG